MIRKPKTTSVAFDLSLFQKPRALERDAGW